ncbi:Amuc_1100 family pilus-like protein [bacterium]|nr:Amuc_1100 family pilus-like protein [bacterium]
MLDLNKNKGFLIALAGAVILLIVGIIMWRGAVSSSQEACDDIESAKSQYNSITKKYGGAPTKKLVEAYEKKLEELNKITGEMIKVAPKKKLPVFNPSSIKAEIRDTKDKIVDLSTEKNIRIPEDIGWSEYLGPNVPKASDIPKLTRQFVIIKDVLAVLCSDNAQVEEITVIDRNPAGTTNEDINDDEEMFDDEPTGRTSKKPKEEEKELYDSVPVQFEFRTTPGSLYTILAGIRNQGYFYRLSKITDKLEIQSLGEVSDPSDITEILSVQLLVDNIQLNSDDKTDRK